MEELLQQLDILKTEYIKLLNDKDVLLNWGKPQLEALYATRIGCHQVELLKLQLRVKALKRKIELLHACINRNEMIDVDSIELQVAAELAQAELIIMQQTTEIQQAKTLLANLDTPERSSELRKIFKQLAKQLHPDVNPEITPEQTEIWHKIKQAYATGDLEKLKALQVVYEKEINAAKAVELSEEQTTLRIAMLKEGIKILYAELEEIKTLFPFTIEAQIKDDEWVTSRVSEIKEEINKLQQYEAQLEYEYKKTIELHGN